MSQAFDSRQLRNALGRFTTGVTIISCVDEAGAFVGLTANSFNSLSLDPPLVLWSLREPSPSLEAFLTAPRFAVNVLAEAQVDLSRRFHRPCAGLQRIGAAAAGLPGRALPAAGRDPVNAGRSA